jgi:hypothetical protein
VVERTLESRAGQALVAARRARGFWADPARAAHGLAVGAPTRTMRRRRPQSRIRGPGIAVSAPQLLQPALREGERPLVPGMPVLGRR